ncbi:uncharacterized protein IAS62_004970 [Cryptococcus decagattii]|uniref:Uncharacterized protein n=1 Tax=Cryptococcus decagattii TaxID=1859122 RepID=A0ABZ2AYJ1_9TREE
MSTYTKSLLPILLHADNLPAYSSTFTTVHPLVKGPPNDDEVDSIELLPVQRLTEALSDGEFKPSSAIVTKAF